MVHDSHCSQPVLAAQHLEAASGHERLCRQSSRIVLAFAYHVHNPPQCPWSQQKKERLPCLSMLLNSVWEGKAAFRKGPHNLGAIRPMALIVD